MVAIDTKEIRRVKMDVSFVIPVLDEAETIFELIRLIGREMEKLDLEYEIIFVDDGSEDSSFQNMKEISKCNSYVNVIKLRRNFGKSVALHNGFKMASGNIVFTMDADLQDDPREIPRFIEKLKNGYDLVSGWKKKRKDPVFSKNLPSKIFNFMVGLVSGLKLHDYNCGFKAYQKRVVKNLTLYGDLHRYIPALVYAMGYRVTEIPVEHHARQFGSSKYGIERFFHGFFDFLTVTFLTKYLKRPMHFFGWFGCLFSLSGLSICSYLTILWVWGEVIGNRPLLILGVLLLLVGLQFLSTGLLAEMITYSRQKEGHDDVVEQILH